MYNFLGVLGSKTDFLSKLNSESLFSDWKCRHRQTFFRSFKMSTIIPTYSSFDILFLLLVWVSFWGSFESSESVTYPEMIWGLKRGICGSFFLSLSFSRSQVVIKKLSNDTFFRSKWEIGWKDRHLSEKCFFHSNNDAFTFKSWQLGGQENEKKKEPILCHKVQNFFLRMPYKFEPIFFFFDVKAVTK